MGVDRRRPLAGGTSNRCDTEPRAPLAGSRTTARARATAGARVGCLAFLAALASFAAATAAAASARSVYPRRARTVRPGLLTSTRSLRQSRVDFPAEG